MMTLQELLRRKRRDYGYTYETMAEALGCSAKHLVELSSYRTKPSIGIDMRRRICRALDVDSAYLEEAIKNSCR